jgi:hypothetical protein
MRSERSEETNMAQHTQANDWEIAIVCQAGGAEKVGGGVFFADVRSQKAMTRSAFLFLGGGFGFGGSIGGAGAPSPGDVLRNHRPDMYTKIPCKVRFSVDDLDCSSGRITSLGAAGAYGYTKMFISAGTFPNLFSSVDVSGWGTGVGISGSVFVGMWKQLGDAGGYGDDLTAMVDDVDLTSDEYSQYA